MKNPIVLTSSFVLLSSCLSLFAAGPRVLYDFEDAAVRAKLKPIVKPGFTAGCVQEHAVGGLWCYALKVSSTAKEYWGASLPLPDDLNLDEYDRIVCDVITLGEPKSCSFYLFLSASATARAVQGAHAYLPLAGGCFDRITLPLKPLKKKSKRLLLDVSIPVDAEVYVDNVTLYHPGETVPPPLPMYTAMKAKASQVSAERLAARERKIHAPAYRAFAEACAAAGQRSPDLLVGVATPMEKIRPRGETPPRAVDPKAGVAVRLARRETEAVQVFVAPKGNKSLKNVAVTVGPLVRAGGAETFPAAQVESRVLGYVQITREAPYEVAVSVPTNAAPGYVTVARQPELGWWPDPILDYLTRTDVAGEDVQGFWVRVKCPEGQAAGTYRGTLTVSADGVAPVAVPFAVRVNGFSVPKESPLPLAITFDPGPTRQHESAAGLARADRLANDPLSPVNQWKRQRTAWARVLADNYVTFDSIYFQTGAGGEYPAFDILLNLKREGRLGYFNLGYWTYPQELTDAAKAAWREKTLARIRAHYDKAKELGLLDRAYIYGCDETPKEFLPQIAWAATELKAACPGVPLSTTAYDHDFGVGTPLSCMDWFTPLTPKWDAAKVEASRRAGHQVWWYICCVPHAPYANLFIETGLDLRMLMGPQTVKYRPDGFLYYQTGIWNSERPISGPSAFTTWEPRSWTTYHGDGSLLCCGPEGLPLPTVRLENLRDGLEDYAYALELERALKRTPDAAWADEAKRLLAVPADITTSLTNFTGDATAVMAWRDRLADLIEAAL